MKAYGSFSYLKYTKREDNNIIIIIQGEKKKPNYGVSFSYFLGQYFTQAKC